VIVPQGALNPEQRTPVSKDLLLAQADALTPVLSPYAVPIKRLAKDILKTINAPTDWDESKRPLTDQYSPANLLRSQ